MKHRPVFVDACCSPQIAKYLEEMGEEVIKIDDSRPDARIKTMARKLGAYIITKDRGFNDYQRAICIKKDNPLIAYNNLIAMKRGEKE